MSEHTKEPWWAGKKFNTCWYCSNRLDAGHNISGTPHYCGKDLSVFDGEDGRCPGYNPDEDAILYYKTKSLDAQRAEAKEVKQQRDELLAAGADDIRAAGWAVAVHNDYRLNGIQHTFWLFTKDGVAVKGEGRTDAFALNQVRAAIKRTEES